MPLHTKRCGGTRDSTRSVLTISRISLFFLSAISFYCGVSGQDFWCMIPLSDKNKVNSVDMYSPPNSKRSILMEFRNWVLTILWNFLKNRENFIFKPEEVYPCVTTMIINKSYIILRSHSIQVRYNSPNTSVNNIKECSSKNKVLEKVKHDFCSSNKTHT